LKDSRNPTSMALVWALLAGALAARSTFAESGVPAELDFKQIWSKVVESGPLLKAAAEEEQAARIGATRASRHWYPRVFVTGRAFATNDPAISFMFTLGQRRIGASDFTPSLLNQPDSGFFEQGTLGVDLPLFEGGMKVAQARAAEKGAQAKAWESKAQNIAEYVRLAQDYAALLSLIEEKKQLLDLRVGVRGVMDHYSIGSKLNPVGYSGLLGLKSLVNRIEGLLTQNEATVQGRRSGIQSAAGDLPAQWRPKVDRTQEFLAVTFPSPISGVGEVPAPVQAARLGAESLGEAHEGERARFLPKVGVFAQGDLYGGSRSTATSYTGGAYLQWDLLSASNFGALGEAGHRAAAAELRADALALKMQSDRGASAEGVRAAETSLKLLNESSELLSEQTQTARQLFRNGSINALQLVEVLNRRIDLLSTRRDAELSLAQAKAALFMTNASEGVAR
jgi:outer membrane protein TolC